MPAGLHIHHTCRNGGGGCINPNHMELLEGTKHSLLHRDENGKISVEVAREIRRLLVETDMIIAEIAERFGVSHWVVNEVGLGRIWKEAGDTPVVYTRVCGWCRTEFGTISRRKRYCCTTHQKWYADRQVYLRKRGTGSTYVRPKRRHIRDPMAEAAWSVGFPTPKGLR